MLIWFKTINIAKQQSLKSKMGKTIAKLSQNGQNWWQSKKKKFLKLYLFNFVLPTSTSNLLKLKIIRKSMLKLGIFFLRLTFTATAPRYNRSIFVCLFSYCLFSSIIWSFIMHQKANCLYHAWSFMIDWSHLSFFNSNRNCR